MCGILAAFKLNSCLTNEEITFFDTARDQMANRGPDSSVLIQLICYLGHRRLAIQDLSSVGSQPAVTPVEDIPLYSMVKFTTILNSNF